MSNIVSTLVGPSVVASAPENRLLVPIQSEGRVGLAEIAQIALDSLVANKVRSLLTMLGVIIGVASVVALIAIGNGASHAITAQVQSIGTNLISIVAGASNSHGTEFSGSTAQTLSLDDANAVAALKLPVAGIATVFSSNGDVVAPAADQTATVIGTTPEYQSLNALVLSSGVFFDQAQAHDAEPVIVLGSKLAKDLFGNGVAVGQTVRLSGHPLRVIGVLATKGGSGFGSMDDRAFIPINYAFQNLPNARTDDGNHYRVSNIMLSVTNSQDIPAVQDRIAALLREQHHLKADGSTDDFNVFNQASILSTLATITTLLTVFLGAIAGISLIVGGIGIMNIMLVSVTERTKEIGLRKAVGARGRDILMQFIVEAIAISLTGGLIGLLLATLLTSIVTLTGLLSAPITLDAILVAVSFSMAVGLFFGIYPARRAARLNPIDALRYE